MAEMEDRSACASPHADRWLSMKEICKHLGVSDDTVYKWINSYDMPAHRLGRLCLPVGRQGSSRKLKWMCG